MSDFTKEEKTELFKGAPSWADSYGELFGLDVFYNEGFYQYTSGGDKLELAEKNLILHIYDRPEAVELVYTKEMKAAGELPLVGMRFSDSASGSLEEARTCLFIDGDFVVYKVGDGKDWREYLTALLSDCEPPIPPVILKNGDCYRFEYNGSKQGIYKESSNRFITLVGDINPESAKHIILLTPGE